MQKIIVLFGSMLLLSGCNRPPETDTTRSEKPQVTTQANTTELLKKECRPLSKQMQKIDSNSEIKDLDQINALLKKCVVDAPNKQQMAWLTQSTQMYTNFFNQEKNTEKEFAAFVDYGYHRLAQEELSDTIKDDPNLFKQMSKRDQYLVKNNHKAYMDLQYVGEGIYEYRRHPNYLLDLFAPHLQKDQQQFIEKMASDNQDIFMNDSAFSIDWSVIAERALYWEKYIQQYPNAYFIEDAKRLFDEYSYYVFLGAANTPISDEFAPNKWIDDDALKTIRQLSKIENSSLANKANKFLKFIETPVSKRKGQFNIKPTDEDGFKKQQHQITYEQLLQLLELKVPWQDHQQYVDCHTDAVCITHRY